MTEVKLLQLTDTHLFAETSGRLRGVVTERSLRRIVDAADTQGPWDAVVVTGDLSQDHSEASYRLLHDQLERLGGPHHVIPGNHDDHTTLAEVFPRSSVTGFQHRFKVGGWQVVVLDSSVSGMTAGRLEEAQLGWLDAQLTRHGAHPSVVFLHHPPLPTGTAWMDEVSLLEPQGFLKIIESHPQVRAVAWGHVHYADHIRERQRDWFPTPSTGPQFRPGTESPACDQALPGYRWFRLADDGTFQTGVERVHPWLDRVHSGGQTGVDRAALDIAAEIGLTRGGWCPHGRWAEDGPIAAAYPLTETPEADTAQRTHWNVRDSDATLVISAGEATGGTALTLESAQAQGKPLFRNDLKEAIDYPAFERWLRETEVRRLHIAGPRERPEHPVYAAACERLRALLTGVDVDGNPLASQAETEAPPM